MQDKLEKLIKKVYKRWKLDESVSKAGHPDEETLVCFLEDRLTKQESESIREHIVTCATCAEIIATQLKLKGSQDIEVPPDLLERVKENLSLDTGSLLEIWLRLKEKFIEILNTTGDILMGQELVPAPIIRSRKVKNFPDEVTILKDFQDIRVEAKIENKGAQAFSLTVIVKEKPTQKILRDLRVTLIKDDVELESYISDAGKVTFEHVLIGKYTVEISTIDKRLASILLDIKS